MSTAIRVKRPSFSSPGNGVSSQSHDGYRSVERGGDDGGDDRVCSSEGGCGGGGGQGGDSLTNT